MGTTFIGRSGKLLRETMIKLGLDDMTGYINTVRCHPPNNRLPKRYARICAQFLYADLMRLDVKVIIALGRTAAQAVMATDSLPPDWAGASYEVYSDLKKSILVLAYHPAYILRRPALKPGWVECLRYAGGLVSQEVGCAKSGLVAANIAKGGN